MGLNTETVRTYMRAYAAGDHAGVDELLADDVVWTVHGHATFRGRAAYVEEMRRGETAGLPHITTDRYVEQDDLVCVTGTVRAPLPDGSWVDLVFSDVFAFDGGRISAVDAYVVPISGAAT